MSTVYSTATYKNFQIVINEKSPTLFEYTVDNPFTQKTLSHRGGYANSTDATLAAEAYINGLDIILAIPTITTALSGDSGLANTVVLALMTAEYIIINAAHITGGDFDGFRFCND